MSANIRERMKSAFEECYQAVFDCEDTDGRQRRQLFLTLPAKKVSDLFP